MQKTICQYLVPIQRKLWQKLLVWKTDINYHRSNFGNEPDKYSSPMFLIFLPKWQKSPSLQIISQNTIARSFVVDPSAHIIRIIRVKHDAMTWPITRWPVTLKIWWRQGMIRGDTTRTAVRYLINWAVDVFSFSETIWQIIFVKSFEWFQIFWILIYKNSKSASFIFIKLSSISLSIRTIDHAYPGIHWLLDLRTYSGNECLVL